MKKILFAALVAVLFSVVSYADHSWSAGGDDGGNGCNAPPGRGCNAARPDGSAADIGWGMSLGRRGQQEMFMRIDPDGTRHITFVTWAIGYSSKQRVPKYHAAPRGSPEAPLVLA